MLYDDMQAEKRRLEQELRSMEQKLTKLPEGRLVCGGSKAHPRYYQCIGNKRKYITKSNYHLAEQLAEKTYIKARLKDIRRQLKGIVAYLKSNHPDLDTAPKLVQSTSKYSKLLVPLFRPANEVLAAWMQKPYSKNDRYPNQLKHDTVNGLKVRSKSEAMIVLELANCRIPFHYEEKLEIEEVCLHPDFTLRHPKTGKTIYWEHFGYLEEASYQRILCHKLQLYMSGHIFPEEGLIITWETRDRPLQLSEIRQKIQKHFL